MQPAGTRPVPFHVQCKTSFFFSMAFLQATNPTKIHFGYRFMFLRPLVTSSKILRKMYQDKGIKISDLKFVLLAPDVKWHGGAPARDA